MKIAILGGGNVYALNFANHLQDLGIEHFGIGRRPPKERPFWQVDHDYEYYVAHLIDNFWTVFDILDFFKPDVVVSFCAQGESAASFGPNTDWYYATNTHAMVRFAEQLRKRDYVRRFIQAGTSECYGSVTKPSVELDPLLATSPYAISKAAFDQHLQVMHRIHGFPMNIMRPSNAFCRGQQLHRIIPRAVICALSGQKLQLQGGGEAKKSYMHASDLSLAILAVIENGQPGAVYNCGPAFPTRIIDLVSTVAVECGVRPTDLFEIVPARTGEDSCYWISSDAIHRDTGWMPIVSMRDGIQEMIRWVKAHPDIMTMDPTYQLIR